MKNEGKIFEEDFANSFPKDVFIYKLRDTSSAWQSDNINSKSRFTVKNVCDYIIFAAQNNTMLLLELKSFKGKSCPFNNIKKHQIEDMYTQSKKEGVKAYFVFNFREISETFAVRAEKVYQFYNESECKSVSYKWCKDKGISIDSKLKRTRFRYTVDILLKSGIKL